jgi:replication factor A1
LATSAVRRFLLETKSYSCLLGRSLASLGSSLITINPDDPNAHVLRGWYDAVGSQSTFTPQTAGISRAGGTATGGGFRRDELKTIKEVKDQELGMHDSADYFSIRGIITQIKQDNVAYPACRGDGCNKKVNPQSDAWYCEKCNQSWDKPEYR